MSLKSYELFIFESKKQEMVNEGIFGKIFNFFKGIKGTKDIDKIRKEFESEMSQLMDKKLDARKGALTKKAAYNKDSNEQTKALWQDAESAANEIVSSIQKQADVSTKLFNSKVDNYVNKQKRDEVKKKLKAYADIQKHMTMINIYKKEQEALKVYGADDEINKRSQDIKDKQILIKGLSEEVKKMNTDINADEVEIKHKNGDTLYYLNDAKDDVLTVMVEDSVPMDGKIKVKTDSGNTIVADLTQLSTKEVEMRDKIEDTNQNRDVKNNNRTTINPDPQNTDAVAMNDN